MQRDLGCHARTAAQSCAENRDVHFRQPGLSLTLLRK